MTRLLVLAAALLLIATGGATVAMALTTTEVTPIALVWLCGAFLAGSLVGPRRT